MWAVFEEGYFKAESSVRTRWGRCVLEILGFYVLLPNAASTWRRQWHPTPVLLPGKSHGWRSLVGYSPWGR